MMKFKNKCLFFSLFALTLCLEIISFPFLSNTVQAQSVSENQINISFNQSFITPPEPGAPSNTVGGASRGDRCSQDRQDLAPYLTPLLPASQKNLTLEQRPIFLVYLPKTAARKAFFSLKDSQGNDYYQTFLDLSEKSGIVQIPLPEDAPILEINKDYKWSFVILCDRNLRPDSPLVEGNVRRIALEDNSQLKSDLQKSTTEIEKAKVYANAGIWYETLAILAQLKQSNPENEALDRAWIDLLKSVGLDHFSEAELI